MIVYRFNLFQCEKNFVNSLLIKLISNIKNQQQSEKVIWKKNFRNGFAEPKCVYCISWTTKTTFKTNTVEFIGKVVLNNESYHIHRYSIISDSKSLYTYMWMLQYLFVDYALHLVFKRCDAELCIYCFCLGYWYHNYYLIFSSNGLK